jgi:3-oxoacyl-(acyl-carrier-protein) synthase
MKRRRVKITGIGPVTPAGIGREEFWKGILEPVSRVRPYNYLEKDHGPVVAAYIEGFDVFQYVDRAAVPKGAARQTLFAIAGAALALADAGISPTELKNASCAITTGSCMMDFGGIVEAIDSVRSRGARAASPRIIYTMGISGVTIGLNQAFGLSAHLMAISTQCSSGMDAIGHAAELVATGSVDMAICGGTEAPLSRFPLLELRAAELTPYTTEMAELIARPFDCWRTTGVVGEGACMFVLEPGDSPRKGYSYISGYSYANDKPGDLCGGMKDAGLLALADAAIRPVDVDAISAWGPGHKLVDLGESRAMQKLFGTRLAEVPAYSIKGAVGSALGAAPAMQVAAAAIGQQCDTMPPTVNWQYPDPDCPLNLSNKARILPQTRTLLNSHGLGGVNASIVLEKC